jgi:hypothetical protein
MVAKDVETPAAAGAGQDLTIRGGGAPLPETARRQMEMRFGQDFSTVRVHTAPDAAFRIHGLDARAYTVGENIHFKPGVYDPHSVGGQQVLAHELVHVVQQRAGVFDGPSTGEGAGNAEPAVTYGVSAPAVSPSEAGAADGAYL